MRSSARLAVTVTALLLLGQRSVGGGGTRLAKARERARLARTDASSERQESLDCGPAGGTYLSSLPAVGLHVISAPDGACGGGSDVATLSVFIDGLAVKASEAVTLRDISCDAAGSLEDWLLAALRPRVDSQRMVQMEMLFNFGRMAPEVLQAIMELQKPPPRRTWRLFSPHGTPLTTVEAAVRAIRDCGTILCYEGGSFIWPGVEVGHVRTLHDATAGDGAGSSGSADVTLTTLSLQPLAFSVDRLMSDEECEWIIKSAGPGMIDAQIVGTSKTIEKNEKRTSSFTLWRNLFPEPQPPMQAIEDRAHRLLRVPQKDHAEGLQVISYAPGQHYGSHMDAYDAKAYKGDAKWKRKLKGGERNRLLTMLWYLTSSSPDSDSGGGGGQTHFPNALGGVEQNLKQMSDCEDADYGLKVTPVRGHALLFYSLRPDGALDFFSQHAGCAPKPGDNKWAVNQWVWNDVYPRPADVKPK